MANKVRSKGSVIAQVGHFHIRQVKDNRKEAKTNGTTLAIMQGKKIIQTHFKNKESAVEAANQLL